MEAKRVFGVTGVQAVLECETLAPVRVTEASIVTNAARPASQQDSNLEPHMVSGSEPQVLGTRRSTY